MTKLNVHLDDLEKDDYLDELSDQTNYVSSNTVKRESLTMRDKEAKHGNKSKAKKARREVF